MAVEYPLRSQLGFWTRLASEQACGECLGSSDQSRFFHGLVQRVAARDPAPYHSIMGRKSGKRDPQVFVCSAMQSVSGPTIATSLTTIYSSYLSQVYTPILIYFVIVSRIAPTRGAAYFSLWFTTAGRNPLGRGGRGPRLNTLSVAMACVAPQVNPISQILRDGGIWHISFGII